jgi:hypothetical protein
MSSCRVLCCIMQFADLTVIRPKGPKYDAILPTIPLLFLFCQITYCTKSHTLTLTSTAYEPKVSVQSTNMNSQFKKIFQFSMYGWQTLDLHTVRTNYLQLNKLTYRILHKPWHSLYRPSTSIRRVKNSSSSSSCSSSSSSSTSSSSSSSSSSTSNSSSSSTSSRGVVMVVVVVVVVAATAAAAAAVTQFT